ncbi:hypothetical protein M885DRAFT_32914 [Pelagophyceae sp. CCMP2097]|nr:hypothetical protein M885DRAFT_32914 [Pelagophyceae sp. CCMP2097]
MPAGRFRGLVGAVLERPFLTAALCDSLGDHGAHLGDAHPSDEMQLIWEAFSRASFRRAARNGQSRPLRVATPFDSTRDPLWEPLLRHRKARFGGRTSGTRLRLQKAPEADYGAPKTPETARVHHALESSWASTTAPGRDRDARKAGVRQIRTGGPAAGSRGGSCTSLKSDVPADSREGGL